ncbi:21.7 kDa class VI heat shock protein-like isoform X1 [Chenopodium quinoa]|uniref:21.7 kDa class VI heat shock protein-like isoform X1 n=1 Tax=Chenopodium quinoa TaxID=63459 RepID=UPI000B78DBAB|nr:21.7 kDa class VI heat shock protein-like isoform X1 [Chenopodium quinoa]
MMASCRQIDVHLEDRTPHKWIVPLTEEVFQAFLSKGNQAIRKVFGDGSFFSPMLFGKFFDPSDAFPLWEFEDDVLLSILRASGNNQVDWSQNDKEYVLKAELPGVGEDSVQVCVEKGKILEVSGQWKQSSDPKARDWKSSHWWEHGFVRRIELPENTDWKKPEVTVKNDIILEIKIPMKSSTSPTRRGDDSD